MLLSNEEGYNQKQKLCKTLLKCSSHWNFWIAVVIWTNEQDFTSLLSDECTSTYYHTTAAALYCTGIGIWYKTRPWISRYTACDRLTKLAYFSIAAYHCTCALTGLWYGTRLQLTIISYFHTTAAALHIKQDFGF